jgi:hypothetical protein
MRASFSSAGNMAFGPLIRYISGGNASAQRIAMTAPVAQKQSEKIAMTAPVATARGAAGEWVIRFFMPSEHSLESLPVPNDERVQLVGVPAETVAVLRYSGTATLDAIASHTDQLLKTLRDNGFTTDGEPFSWFYDPPWTIPFRRRNEVAVKLAPIS